MSMQQGLSLTQKQTLKLNTQMIQSLEMMSLTLTQLQERISTEMLENPTLQAQEKDPVSVSYEEYSEKQLRREQKNDNYSDSYDNAAADSWQSWFENTLTQEESLKDHLLWQLGCTSCPDNVRDCAAAIISDLDDNGFFSQPLYAVLNERQMACRDEALALIHSFDPAGIACSDFRQSLILQAQRAGLDDEELALFSRLVNEHLGDMQAEKYTQVCQHLHISREDLDDLYDFLKTLNPHPASAFSAGREVIVIPDVSIKVEDGRLVVRLNDSSLPVLSIDSGYQEMESELSKSKSQSEKEAARYLKKEIQSARELIRQLDMRNTTLEKVAKVLAVRQKGFFLFGLGSLRPLTLKDVAQEIGVHEATVSRITSNKYVDTDWGIIPMKNLFSSAVRTNQGEEGMSKEAVKQKILSIIENNTTGRALSDQRISDLLKAEGIECARRTVSKYRRELDISSSFNRSK